MTRLTRSNHAWHESFHTVDGAPQIDANDPLPALDRCLPHTVTVPDTGVVAQNVHVAELFVGKVGKRFDRSEIGHVASHRATVNSLGEQSIVRGGQRRVLDVGNHHVHACGAETLRHGQADTRCTARDDRGLARQIPENSRHVPLFSRSRRSVGYVNERL